MKQGIEKVLEEFRQKFVVEKYARYGGYYNAIDSKKGTSEQVEAFLRSAIETALREVRPRPRMPVGDSVVYGEGYVQAISDYDQAVNKFLGR